MTRPPIWLVVTLSVVAALVASLAAASLGDSPTSADSKKPLIIGPCANGIAVPGSWGNPGLIQDCNILLGLRDTLANSASHKLERRCPHRQMGTHQDRRFPRESDRDTPIRLGVERHDSAKLGKLTDLRKLNLSNNSLTGSIPPELGGLSNLTHLYLNANRLTGEIPSQLSDLWNLREMWLQDNTLTGEIPVALSELHGLEYLYLHGNEFSGCIPKALADKSGLRLRTDDDLEACTEDDLPLPKDPCANGVAVSNPRRNPELVGDCNALLASRDTLAGDATLNCPPAWSRASSGFVDGASPPCRRCARALRRAGR